jgi:hypothetical protein
MESLTLNMDLQLIIFLYLVVGTIFSIFLGPIANEEDSEFGDQVVNRWIAGAYLIFLWAPILVTVACLIIHDKFTKDTNELP